ncbi:MAG TPA: bifunctional DNA-formamidopyrimidine glycosylase/DNA-(apurinic or apyrimidinic site) lyase [Gaiella sp.]|uniref:bifunctional DNA-formamidopyrimidine glycosylase/DNA-(apurinic or apyrimidinic site) lyase n=1 Tax=Gaiella sp. TaxID=2663207 RepID=UPI002D7EEEC6|nr:bifunctional DNA-formamidopyrimidine glycosylase/DNA-(apurinic or apyrimidinic site) lyase [Gaiella sp.]HET9288031.1 bifunctional DNA-formamidopyrimidine glycosylase/DNA-(apurinic or apyrimidinic site) lyase [Gaiella sp.]
MPELPEVETVRRRLAPLLEGATIAHAEIVDPRLTRPVDPGLVADALVGEQVAAVERRGKYLLWRLTSGRTLVVHLRMTGSLRHAPAGELPADAHRRATLGLDTGAEVAYRDVRRFGTWELLDEDHLRPYLASRLGPEPLAPSFTAARLARIVEGRRAPIKAVLLDQRRIAGIGNIYADEALWRARIHPRRPAGELDAGEVARLHRAVRAALRRGVELQGSTLRDYVTPDGDGGGMQHEFHVYGRLGEPCDRCGRPIERIVVAGRGTWLCPRCQRP